MTYEQAFEWAFAPERTNDVELQKEIGRRQEKHLRTMPRSNPNGLEDAFAAAVTEIANG